MSVLHWFKRKSEIAEAQAEPDLSENLTADPANTPEPTDASVPPTTGPGMLLNEPVSAEVRSIPHSPAIASELAATETHVPPAIAYLSVPIGAFYAKLPAHLLVAETPDLARCIQIAEEDVVLDQETQEATLPLSILSLSCPDIFDCAVSGSEDVPVTFSIRLPKDLEPPPAQESVGLKEMEAPLAPVPEGFAASVEQGGQEEIKVRLGPILTDFPPQLEPPEIDALIGTQAEIALPLGLIQSQLAHGRVIVPGEMFCKALPIELKPYFESIDPAAEIPIPLPEIFLRLPPGSIKLREDQEMYHPEERIPTPFSKQADEDAERFGEVPVKEAARVIQVPQPEDEPSKVAVARDSKRLQAIFLTEEPLDLAKTIHGVAELPGLRSCLLCATDGVKLAGNLGDPDQEKLISASLPELFQWAGTKLEGLQAGALETITLSYGGGQMSTFVHGNLCLTVLHDNSPFKPGVREKIRAVLNGLAAVTASVKPF